ncbi:MAG: sugar transferase [Candidatus Dormibacteraceae bacterium]
MLETRPCTDEQKRSASDSPHARPSRLPTRPRSAYAAARSVIDLLLALAALILLSPVLLAIAVVTTLDSPGPVFFRQMRAGRSGRPFAIIKFRTMHADSPHYSDKVPESDPHITRFGGILRRSGLDEVPQLLNVVRGEMALIGPRPEQMPLLSRYEPWQLDRHLVKPGITGWWQVHHRDGIPMYQNVARDLYYIENMGPKLDLIIVGKTLAVLTCGLRPRRRGERRMAEIAPGPEEAESSPSTAFIEDLSQAT